MRDLTKSIASFSWAMSLFGARQLANLFRPSEAAESFDAVTQATERQLGDVLRSAFQMGDRIQRGMVDITFGLMGMSGLEADRWAGAAADAMGRAADAAGSGLRGASWGPAQETGWGPMPQRDATGVASTGAAAAAAAGQAAAAAQSTIAQPGGWGPVPAERG